MSEAKWYVAHTYSGYENKVCANIKNTVENRKLQDQILEVLVPQETETEISKGKEKLVQRKMFPGYVLVHMIMNDDTWYVVRNTRGVTGFVGPGSKPVPLTDAEVARITNSAPVVEKQLYEVGDSVTVISGVWEGTVGTVKSVNASKKSLTIGVDMFGGETPAELSFTEVKKN